jgi:chromosome segregation ATPase
LEQNIRETYNLIDNDEIVSTMKQNAVSDDYRKQRINEILEDSLLQEKEIQIEKLNQVNAYLKTELRKAEDEKTKIKQVYQEEVMKFQKTFSDFESVIEQEARAKTQYKQEYELIASNLQKISRQNEDVLAEREAQLYESSQMYQAEMTNLKNELNFLREKALNEESNAKRKDSLIMEMQKDLEIFRREYAALEFNYTTLLNEHSSVSKKSAAHQEITTQYENEIKNLREQLQRVEEEFRNCQGDLGNVLKEKTDLLSKTEYISSQVKKVSTIVFHDD